MPNFSDIIGQAQIVDHLKCSIEQNKVSHAYIICGERYSGKEYIARIFAAALLCDDKDNAPCGKCHNCSQAFTDNNPDIVKVTHEKPMVISVDDIRTQVNEDILIKPYGGKRKIYIINEAEKMNQQAQNALLKTLEEPPEYAVILLLTTNLEEMLQTIKSRCVVLNMRPVSDKEVRKYLMEEEQLPEYTADMSVAFARGNLGKAKLLARNEEFDQIMDEALHLMHHLKELEVYELNRSVKRANDFKIAIGDYLDLISVWYRDVLMFKATADADNLIFKKELAYIKKVADSTTYENLQDIIDAIDKAKRRIAANVNFDLTMELLFLTLQEKDSV